MNKKISFFQWNFMRVQLEKLREIANESVKQGAEASGSAGDGHHDEGYQLSMRETWKDDSIANKLEESLSQTVPFCPIEEQSDTVQIGSLIVLDNDQKFVVDTVAYGKGVISNPIVFGKKVGDKLGKFIIKKILSVKEAEKFFNEKNKNDIS